MYEKRNILTTYLSLKVGQLAATEQNSDHVLLQVMISIQAVTACCIHEFKLPSTTTAIQSYQLAKYLTKQITS